MGLNCGYACSKPGIFKIITLALGLASVICLYIGYNDAKYFKTERTFTISLSEAKENLYITEKECLEMKEGKRVAGNLFGKESKDRPCPREWMILTTWSFIGISFLASLAVFFVLLCVELNQNGLFNQLDFIGHIIAGVCLLIGAILVFCFVGMGVAKIDCSEKDNDKVKEWCETLRDNSFAPVTFGVGGGIILINAIIYFILGPVINKQ